MSDRIPLQKKSCRTCEGGTPPLNREKIEELLGRLDGWEERDGCIRRDFAFKNFLRTMAFVNAVAWVALRENHHPDLEVGYDSCLVSFTTHAIGGLSENDFICAAKVDALVDVEG